jgi:hypothetical protein
MEQRRLRLGDILDDYCPRERRVTNHAVVAMIEEDVKQTRCMTCDAEHVYKGGKAPKRRKKETPAALYKEVLAGMPEANGTPALTEPPPTPEVTEPDTAPEPMNTDDYSADTPVQEDADAQTAAAPPQVEDGPVHRPLIRATLPRPEGQKDARPLPEFTVRHNTGRGNGHFRSDQRPKQRGGGGQTSNGNRPGGGQRFAGGSRQGGQSRGQGGGFNATPQPRRGGRKRSR